MGKRYLIDTSAYSKYLTGQLSPENSLFVGILLNEEFLISVITRIELQSWITDDEELDDLIDSSLSVANVFHISEPIIKKTIEIRRKAKVKLPDALIAATAIIHGLILLSTNDKDFIKIPRLKYQSLN
jgi:predicted nucleic acid-binding protein